MTQAECPACKASIDISDEPPGTRLRCPDCGQAELPIPEAAREIELLDPSLEVFEEADQRPDLQPDLRPDLHPMVKRKARSVNARRRSGGGAASSAGQPLLIGGAAIVLLGGLLVVFRGALTQDAEQPSSKPEAAVSATNLAEDLASLSREDQYQKQRDALTPGDLPGRLRLAEVCAGQGLEAERLQLLQEALLLDAGNAVAREALGFRKYSGSATRYRGDWLDAEDYALAEAAEPSKSDDGR